MLKIDGIETSKKISQENCEEENLCSLAIHYRQPRFGTACERQEALDVSPRIIREGRSTKHESDQ